MMTNEGYRIDVPEATGVVSDVRTLVNDTAAAVRGLASAALPGTTYAGIGSAVGAAGESLHTGLVQGLGNLARLVESINQNIERAVQGYTQADTAVADGFGRNAEGENKPTAGPAQSGPTVPADPNTPLTADQLVDDPILYKQIAAAEDSHKHPLNHVYQDSVHKWTVGHGFNLDDPSATARLAAVGTNPHDVRKGTTVLTDAQIETLYRNDLRTAVTGAQRFYDGFDQLAPARQRVLTDMAFNLGYAKLEKFHGLHQALVDGDYDRAAESMQNSAWYKQVGHRSPPMVEHMRTGVQ